MTNPDRTELSPQSILAPENPKKNGHIPRWLRMPAFTTRMFLATLAATPGTVLVADAIIRTTNPSIVYADASVNFNLNSRLEPPGLDTRIRIMAGQHIVITASGKANYGGGQGEGCNTEAETDPDGNRYLRELTCPPLLKSNAVVPTAAIGALIARIDSGPWFPVGSHYTAITDSSGYLFLLYNDANNWSDNTGGYNVTVNITTPLPTPRPLPTSTPDALDIQIAAQNANNAVVATELAKVEEAQKIKATQVATLDKAQNEYNALQDKLAAARAPVLSPPERATATQAARQASSDATREAIATIAKGQIDATATTASQQTATAAKVPTPVAPTRIPSVPRPDISSNPAPAATTSEVPGWIWGVGGVLLAGLAYKAYERWKPSTKTASSGVAAQATVGAGSTARIGGIAGAIGTGPNSNSAPNFGPTQPKNPEWIAGQSEFGKRWQDAKRNLSPLRPGDTGNEPEYILDRFKAAMNIVHEVSLGSLTRVPLMAVRVRAGIESLVSEIWPNNRIFKRFFDPNLNAGYLTVEDLAKIIYLPQQYRTLTKFDAVQRNDVTRIHRILIHALHPDTSKSDADPNLQDSVDDLLKTFNPAWLYVESLIK